MLNPWLGFGLDSRISDGNKVLIGVDPILGGEIFIGFPLLQSLLNLRGFKYLSEIKFNGRSTTQCRVKAESIGVWGSFAKEWDRYVDGINHMGVRLLDKVEEIVWIGT